MASNFPPGWYPTPTGDLGYWDGKNWTGDAQPPAPESRQIGWHLQDGGLYRWWLGTHWSEAHAAVDGHVDVARGIGQAMIYKTTFQSMETTLNAIRDELTKFPPSRICRSAASSSHSSRHRALWP
ncbi:DUF2510 domain-containing protein [Leucobacter iarius]|uniref:DUF2510 domain-containing protein n=1 Tax=Leucobacter iarius TaxID=333963 RepID=UPI003CD0AF34